MKNRRNIFFVTLLLLIALVVGLLIGSIIPQWTNVESSFYKVRIIEIGQLILPILVAILVSYVISGRITFDMKSREIIIEILSRLQEHLSDVLDIGYEYVKSPNAEKEKKILKLLKDISSLLGLIKEVGISKNIQISDLMLHYEFWKFKKALTDTPFKNKSPVYEPSRLDIIQSEYDLLTKKIYECKLRIFQ